MLPNSGNPRDLALHRLTVAKEDLATAKDDFIGKHFRAANNRAYYSIYHSITAVLALEQVAFKRHKDTIAYFNQKEGLIPRSLLRNKLFQDMEEEIY